MPIQHYKYQYMPYNNQVETFIECDNQQITRQCSISGNNITSSVTFAGDREYPELSEYSINEEVGLTPISAAEFNQVWVKVMQSNHEQWINAMRLFPVGSRVTTEVMMFYPQGVISRRNNTLFLSSYEDFEHVVPTEKQYPGTRFSAVVRKHDVEQQLLILSKLSLVP